MNKGKFAVAMAGLFASGSLFAQSNCVDTACSNLLAPTAGFASIPVELLPPGARALGLAGAFTAVADDATAAEANPAGFTILRDPEVSFHFRDTDNDIDFYDPEARNPGAFSGQTGSLIKNYSDSSNNLSFASVVYPWERFVFSAFYTNNLDIDADTPTESILDNNFVDEFVSDNALRSELDGFGISGAWRVNDIFSIGLTIKHSTLDLATIDRQTIRNFRDFEFVFDANLPGVATPQEWATVVNDEFIINNSLNGDDSDTTFNLGLLLRPNDKWSFGLVFKEGGSFDISGVNSFSQSLGCMGSGPLRDICDQGFTGIDLTPFNNTVTTPQTAEVDIPDRYTLGVAYRPDDTWLLSLDVNRIQYSDLPQPRTITLGFNFPVDGIGATAQGNDIEPIDDDTSLHFGVEKVFFPSADWITAFTVRAGAFTDDDHDGTRLLDTDDTHVTFGLGGVFNRLQVDLAAEFSDRVDNIVLSGIYRFQ